MLRKSQDIVAFPWLLKRYITERSFLDPVDQIMRFPDGVERSVRSYPENKVKSSILWAMNEFYGPPLFPVLLEETQVVASRCPRP